MKVKRLIKQTGHSDTKAPHNSEPSSTAPKSYLRNKPIAIGLIAIGCVVIVILIRTAMEGGFTPEPKAPTYTTVLPKDKSINELGGWKRVSPPKKDPVFAFNDTLDTVAISVSQQPLPESFKNNINDQVAELAQKFNATEKISAGSTTVYIGTSFKGPQSVIFTKNNVLVLIKSEKKIQNTSWTSYIEALD